jgi:Gpi18-like mannosyltransferase
VKPQSRNSAEIAPRGQAARPRRRQPRHFLPLVIAGGMLAVSAYVRIVTRSVVTTDLDFHILAWYAKLQQLGPFAGLGKDFYNYTPPYLYLLALGTLTSRWFAPVIVVKMISTVFDGAAAYVMFRLVRLWRPEGYAPHLAAAAFFSAPTVVANSGVWGQADSTYTLFVLGFLYFVLVELPIPAMISLGTAFAFKPQAVFFAPLVLILILWKKMPWYLLVVVPAVYAILMVPAVIAGRTWLEVLTVYTGQAGSGKGLTHNAPTLYAFVPKSAFDKLLIPAILLAILVSLAWAVWSGMRMRRRDNTAVLLLALVSAALTPFLLPNMHDRYFYPADILSIALAFVMPEMWFIAVMYQAISGLAYSIYLLSAPSEILQAAALINILALVLLLVRQAQLHAASARLALQGAQLPPSPP